MLNGVSVQEIEQNASEFRAICISLVLQGDLLDIAERNPRGYFHNFRILWSWALWAPMGRYIGLLVP